MADGWNVYFFDDLKTLVGTLRAIWLRPRRIAPMCTHSLLDSQPSRWAQYGTNTETVGELWLGLLRFYTEEFDFKEHVVCTRQKARLTTFNKQWTSKYIVIEGQSAPQTFAGFDVDGTVLSLFNKTNSLLMFKNEPTWYFTSKARDKLVRRENSFSIVFLCNCKTFVFKINWFAIVPYIFWWRAQNAVSLFAPQIRLTSVTIWVLVCPGKVSSF